MKIQRHPTGEVEMRNALVLAVMFSLMGCLGDQESTRSHIEVAVAPLSLSGITNAQYTVTVTNAPAGSGEVVWSRTVTSDQYGDGSGSITYVGPCDGGKRHTVTLTLDALYAGGLLDAGTYENPTPVRLEADCLENRDTPVRFDITLMRQADQGFFDVAVQFEDIFCSAKLDCQTDAGGDLDLLFNGQTRDMTAVLGFACISGEGQTYLYMDDLVIDCAGTGLDVRVAPTGMGATPPTSNPGNYLFAAATYRGLGEGGVAYWNVGLGLDAAAFATMGACTLTTRATASSTPWDQEVNGFPFPEASVYPVISWQAQLTDDNGRVCTRHEVGSDEVQVDYLGYLPTNAFTWSDGPLYMQHRLTPGENGGTVVSAGSPICNPSCDHGTCVSTNVCDCDAGWDGQGCEMPVCTGGCGPGICVAPDTCDCLVTGFFGDTCGDDIDECALDTDGCDQGCDNSPGGFDCLCDPGYTLDVDGITCLDIDECSGGATCDANATCDNTDGAYICQCNPGFSGDSVTCSPCADGEVKPSVGNEACVSCEVGTFDDGDEECAPCTSCNPGEFIATGCSTTTNTECQACPPGEVQPFSNETSCVVCGPESFDNNTETCQPCTTCGAGEYEVGACTSTSDRSCGVCPAVAMCEGGATCSGPSDSICDDCQTGYAQVMAGADCTDIDECASNHGGCDANATCTNTQGSFTCECEAGYIGDGVTCVAAYSSCLDAHESGETASTTYVIDPDGAGPIVAQTVYCDMVTDGGGWTLMAKFTQHQGVNLMPAATYNAYFGATGANLWIEGNAMARPTTPTPSYDTYHIESVDWREHLVSGRRYQIRQHAFKGAGTSPFDVRYTFTHQGHVKQDGASPSNLRAWSLEGRQILTDSTGITWSSETQTLFWLPFSSNVADPVYTACASYALTADGCAKATAANRRYGNAGIIGTAADGTDPAFAWAPHTNTAQTFDLVYVHQAASTYGTTGSPMALLYWVREESCTTNSQCSSGLCEGDGTCLSHQPSCMALREAGVVDSGTYTLDRDGAAGPVAPVQAYCDMVTDGGGWMYVGETGRSATNIADTYVSNAGDYHRYIYDLRGFTYDQALVVRPSGYYWCDSWGSDATYWGHSANVSMGIAANTSTFNYHNGQTNPYAWIEVPYSQSSSCSNCWTANNTKPSMVSIAALDAAGSIVKLDPPGGQLSHLEVSNFDAFITQAGGCNLTGGRQATWRAFVRAAPSGNFAQLEGPAQTFAANAWTGASFNAAPIASGVSVSGSNLTFGRTGVYRVTLSYRSGEAGDVWTAVRLFGNGATQGVSAGYGNFNTYSPELQTVEFLATVPTTSTTYQIQVGRLASAMPVVATNAISEVNTPSVQATVERITDLTPTRPHAQLERAAQTFAANAWTAANWTAAPRLHGMTVNGSDIAFAEPGIYRVTFSYRHGTGGDVWTSVGLFGDGVVKGMSVGHGNAADSHELFTTTFLANVDNIASTWQLRVGRLSAAITMDNASSIAGVALPSVQATVVKESGTATSYAQLQGPAQTFAASAWTAASFNAVPVAANISASGNNITINEPGVYRVTLSYRQGTGADVWTAVRLFGFGATAGLSAGYGNVVSSPELFTTTFLATVVKAGTYQIQIGRLLGPVTVISTSAIAGITPPAVQATIIRVR